MSLTDKLFEIFKQYQIATGKDINDNSIKLGIESDWLRHEARELLDVDPTGLLSVLTMRLAFKTFIKEHSCTIEELLNGEWNVLEEKFVKLKHLLYTGEVGEIYNKFMELIINHSKVLGKNYTIKQIESIKNIEKILTDSIKKFNNKYDFHHEKFNNGEMKINKNAAILPRLYRFEHLKAFVDSMKNTSEDNFICVALIDRTNEIIENEYYDTQYDSFFAYGFKNNGVVWVISDRVVFDSPDGAFKTRNPGRQMRDKVNYSWLPYYKLDSIKQQGNVDHLLLTFNNNVKEQKGNNIVDLFDDEGIIYSVLIMTLIYNKYFCQKFEDNSKRLYFSSEIKLLPQNSEKALALKDELHLPTPANNIKAETYCYEDKSYSNSLYDYLIDIYPLDTTTPVLKSFIGDKDKAQQYVWWNIRKQQAKHIQDSLENDYHEKYQEFIDWQKIKIFDNLPNIIDFMVNSPDRDGYTENFKSNWQLNSTNNAKKCFWEAFRDGDYLDTYKLTTTKNDDNFKVNHWFDRQCTTKYGNIRCNSYGSMTYIWFPDDNDRRYCSIELILRSHDDLCKLFNIENKDLPKLLQKHFYSRSGPCSKHAWMPYVGNSILEFTDPMNDIRDPFEDFGCIISIVLSKSMLKRLGRKI